MISRFVRQFDWIAPPNTADLPSRSRRVSTSRPRSTSEYGPGRPTGRGHRILPKSTDLGGSTSLVLPGRTPRAKATATAWAELAVSGMIRRRLN
jgi:hypothetical protein